MNTSAVYRPSRIEYAATIAAIWALAVVTFRLPGRDDPSAASSLDLLALAKLAIRSAVFAFFLFAWRWNPDTGAKLLVGRAFFPFYLFIAWAFVSVLWSPLKTVSLGQALGLAAQVTLAAWIALAFRVSANAALLIRQLWAALLVCTVVILTVHAVSPELSGLDRELELAGANGFVRPTAAGSTAGLGLTLTILAPRLIPGVTLGPGVLVALPAHAALLFLANSRTAWAMTLAVSALAFVRFYPSVVQARTLTLVGLAAAVLVLVDPGFSLQEDSSRAGAEYLSRGQSAEQLSRVSGRMEMWQAVWGQFEMSPIIGHGYFVSSASGELDVWDGPANHTAHNIGLQVLVSTGVIGAVLFVAATARVVSEVFVLRRGDSIARGAFAFTALLGVWYAGWSQTCISFLGPILPESVAFFVVLGVAVGQAVRTRTLSARRRVVTP
ncbi:MAG: O-antigen ligase family protein [Planctomycetota bacterium]